MSQHYTINGADNTLAWSLAQYAYKFPRTFPGLPEEVKAEVCAVSLKGIGDWIKRHTTCVNLTIPADRGPEALDRLERIALRVLRPVFEGRWQQKRGGA